jgi:hypothetical protein
MFWNLQEADVTRDLLEMGFSKAQVQHAIEKCGIYTKFKP